MRRRSLFGWMLFLTGLGPSFGSEPWPSKPQGD